MTEQYSSFKLIGGLVGVILLIISIVLLISGFSLFFKPGTKDMGDEGWFEEQSSRSSSSFGLIAGGMFLLFIGIFLIYTTQIRNISKYYATETAPAIETVGGAVGKGVASGIREAGGIQISNEADNKSKEIIRIKCRSCGYLETEDAEFCSKCGSRV